MSAHTPGPWTLFKDEARLTDVTHVLGPKGEIICSWHRAKADRRFNEPTIGNQHLLAAAPDLLAVLERIVAEADPEGGAPQLRNVRVREARAAIARARGVA